jgi:hypothetical protein
MELWTLQNDYRLAGRNQAQQMVIRGTDRGGPRRSAPRAPQGLRGRAK